MNWVAAFRPRRDFALPFLMALLPVLYLVYRDAGIACASETVCLGLAHTAYAFAGIIGSYLVAIGVLGLVDARSLTADHPYARLAFQPTDRTLLVLVVFVGAIAAYVFATLITTIPAWLDHVLTPFGIVAGLPFVVTSGAMTLVGNALGGEPAMSVQLAVVALSLCATGTWLFALATGTARVLESGGLPDVSLQ